jgi:hypothetical protein
MKKKDTTLQELAAEFLTDGQRTDDAEITVLRLCRRLKIDLRISAADAQRIKEAEIRPGRTRLPDKEVKANTLYQRAYRARKQSGETEEDA